MAKSIQSIRLSIANDLIRAEELARLDEREKLNAQWKAYVAELEASYKKRDQEWNEKLVRLFSDRNGEKTVGQRGKSKRGFLTNSSLGRVYRCLAIRKYGINKKTLVRETGMSDKAVEVAIYKLRKQGYKIECTRIGYVRPKYRLAS